jgi:hypothetical protein
MATPANHEDVKLILHLYELRREARMREARAWLSGKFSATTMEELQQQAPPGSQENNSLRMVTSYWDMAASFVLSGVLNKELFCENCTELLFVWEKMKQVVPGIRGFLGNPNYLANLEKMAAAIVEHKSKNAPEFHEGFQRMVKATTAT